MIDSAKVCLHPHPDDDRLDHSLAKHIDMETMLAVQLSEAHTAIRSALVALDACGGHAKKDRAVLAAKNVLKESLP